MGGLVWASVLMVGCASSSPEAGATATTPAGTAPTLTPTTLAMRTTDTPAPAPPSPARPSHAQDSIPFGVYAMMDWARVAGAGEGKAYPWVKAGHYAFTWRQVNPARGQFDWDLVDRWLTMEAGSRENPTGKRVGLGINAYEGGKGDAAPQWVLDDYPMLGYSHERRVLIASSEHEPAALRPELSIAFRPSGGGEMQVISLQQGREGFDGWADTWLDAANPPVNHAHEHTLMLGAAGQANGLLRVPLDDVPPSAQVVSATLVLHVLDAGNGNDALSIEAYAMRRPWSPAGATWLLAEPGKPWTIRGANGIMDEADRQAQPCGTATIAGAGPVAIPLDPTTLNAWLSDPRSNLGLLIKQRRGDAPLPRYWDEGYLGALADMVHALAERYGEDPRVAWVEISVGIYGETAPANAPALKWSFAEAGLTSDVHEPAKGLFSWVETVKRIIDIYRSAFPEKPLFLQYSNYFESISERASYVPYAVERGIGLKHNGLYPDSIDGVTYGGPSVGTFNIMFTYSETVPVGWEFQVFPRTESNVYWAMLNALDKHADFVMVQKDAITRTELIPIFEFANQYLGATLDTTPAVWVALRETERPAERWFPQFGNFSFWLYQEDAGPGGQTVPLWNVTDAKEGRFTRRTDQANGNRYMYFNVDDRYVHGPQPVVIEVVYLDQGRDRWHLEYDAGEHEPKSLEPVQKEDTGTWKRARFRLMDAAFAGGIEGYDFRIDCDADGDEIIHWVQVSRLEG